MPAYQVEDLSVAFPAPAGASGVSGASPAPALDKVGFHLAAGELLVVLGPAGAGKTTLLRTLAGLERPRAGRILEDADAEAGPRDLGAVPPHRRDIAMVFQDFSLYPRLKVGENLAFPLRSRALGLPEAEVAKRVQEAAAFLGLADKLERRPGELSDGERQRVALGRALVRRPRLFLLDEPLAHLDARLRERMGAEIRRLQRGLKAAMVYATHDPVEAMSLADRILVLHRGKVLQVGTPEEIYRHPVDSRVARMLGRPAINLFDASEAARLGLAEAKPAGPGAAAPGVVGVRPESWRVTPDPSGPAVVRRVEHLGPSLGVALDLQGTRVRALVPVTLRLKPGDRVRLGVDPADILHLES